MKLKKSVDVEMKKGLKSVTWSFYLMKLEKEEEEKKPKQAEMNKKKKSIKLKIKKKNNQWNKKLV